MNLKSTAFLSLFCCFCLSLSFAARFTPKPISLLEKRGDFQTNIIDKETTPWALEEPPADIFELITYQTSLGEMEAYISPAPDEAGKHPAIIWLTGGFPGSSPGSWLWAEPNLENEQTASVYRKSGIISMYPSLRGRSSKNPGYVECFYGEVNDVIDAYHHLAGLEYVDANRIYLGGHSTGGTLALLVAASTDRFAGVISLGPTDDDYGQDNAPYEWTKKERSLRSPIEHLSSIKSQTFIIEGTSGNHYSLQNLYEKKSNPLITVIEVQNSDHFQLIHPVNTIFSKAITQSKDGTLDIDSYQVHSCMAKR